MKLNKHRIYCTTDTRFEYWWLEDGASAPTTCPVDTGHAVSGASVIVDSAGGAPRLDESDIALQKPQPQNVGYEMCERDFKVTTCKMTQAGAVEDLKVNPATLHEVAYEGPELALVGVYKDDAVPTDPRVACTDQADADVNGVLTVWDYKAYDQSDGTTQIPYDVRCGALVIDPAVPAGERFSHRAYIMVAPDAGQANFVRLWDGYMAGRPNEGELSTESPVAKLLNPELGAGVANVVRIYVFHPAGQSNDHILWLMTYRPKGTF